MVSKVTDDFADHSLGMLPKVRIEKIVVLPWPVVSGRERWRIGWIIWVAERGRGAVARQKNFRMVLVKPRWNRVSRCAKNGLDSCLVQSVQHSLHPRKLKIAIARLPTAPRC